jgi:alcohol dehydrogenase (NADP+)
VIGAIAGRHGASPAQVLLCWGLQRGTVVLAKSVTPQRIEANLQALGLSLSDGEMDAIAGLERRHRFISGTIWTPEGSPYTLASLWDEGLNV